MIHSTTDEIAGYKVKEVLGVVRGNSVKAKWFGADFLSGLKNMVGGELNHYQKLFGHARENAISKMDEDAEKLGADAIVGMKFMTSQIAQGSAEILVYGTAVKLKK
ncbi:MAG: YbjQ family protein [Nanobdellota archaeon]